MIFPLSAPVLYAIELTPVCNNQCRGCCNVFATDRRRAPLAYEDWRVILARIKPHAHLVKLTGGEPTLHPQFEEIVLYLQELNILFSIFTNGCWNDPARLIDFLLHVPQFRGFLISLHGATSAAHEAFSGVSGSYERAVTNIRGALEAGLGVTMSTVINNYNLAQLPDIVALADALGVDHLVFNRYIGAALPEVEPAPAQLIQAVQLIENLRTSDGADTPIKFGDCIPQCFVPSSASGCLAGVAYCTIDPWGNMRPCNHSPVQCGNLFRVSVQEAWNSAEMREWRARIPAECHQCAVFAHCHGGCHALGDGTDPLMRGLLEEWQAQPTLIELGAEWRPVRVCDVREESFGYVLLRGNRVAPLAFDDKAILDFCDGTHTLRAVERGYGARGLRIVNELYQKRLVEWADGE